MDDHSSENSQDDFRYDLFISYSSTDRFMRIDGSRIDLVKALKQKLEQHSHPEPKGKQNRFRVCTYEEDFELDDTVRSAIRSRLEQCRTLLVLCSDAAAKSPYVTFELQCFSELHPDKKPLGAAVSRLPATAFPNYFSDDRLAANLQYTSSQSRRDWKRQIAPESHKIVAAVWKMPLERVNDRFERERKAIRHRWIAVTIIFCLLLVGVSGVAVRQAAVRAHLEQKQAAVAHIDSLQNQLMTAIEELNSSIEGSRGSVKELEHLTSVLEQRTKEFTDNFGANPLSDADAKALERALATIDIAKERFQEALSRTDDAESDAVGLIRIRAGAFFGLRKWKDALARYEAVLGLEPTRMSCHHAVALCHANLNRLDPAIAVFSAILDAVQRDGPDAHRSAQVMVLTNRGNVFVRQGKLAQAMADFDNAVSLDQGQGGFQLASTRRNRAFALTRLGRLQEAIADLDEAMDIFRSLAQQQEASEDALALAYQTRGIACRRQGSCTRAIEDFDNAIDIYERIVQGGKPHLANGLASALDSRAGAMYELGQGRRAMEYYDKAIRIRIQLVGEYPELEGDLAASHHNRGVNLQGLGMFSNALADHNIAVDIYTRLVNDEGRSELAYDLASSHLSRGNALRGTQRRQAIADYTRAIAIYTRLADIDGRSELPNALATSYDNRGNVRGELGQFAGAIDDFSQTIGIYGRLVDEGHGDLAAKLASTHTTRGLLAMNAHPDMAIEDFDTAIEIYTNLIHEGQTDFEVYRTRLIGLRSSLRR